MSEPMKLQVETGAVTVELEDENGGSLGSFSFQPTDSNMFQRYGAVVDALSHMSYEETDDEAQNIKKMNALAADIAGQFDYLLGGPVSDGIFAKCGPLTVTKNGDFYFERVLEGIGGLIEQVTKKRLDKKLAKIRKAAQNMPSARRKK